MSNMSGNHIVGFPATSFRRGIVGKMPKVDAVLIERHQVSLIVAGFKDNCS